MSDQQTVCIVDDDEGVRSSLSMLLESVDLPHRSYASALEFLEEEQLLRRGCLVLDIRMPGMSGLELQAELRKREVNLPIIFITGHGDIPMAVEAMRQGALDFIAKPFREQDLLDRIHKALALEEGKQHLQDERAELLTRLSSLTPREREVFERVSEGRQNKVIAYELGISERTVEVHRAQVMTKLGARTLTDLVRIHIRAQAPIQ